MAIQDFTYQPTCSVRGCSQPALYKVAAPWSNGTSSELKNYGLSCEEHRDTQLVRARAELNGLALAEGETVGPVGLYQLVAGQRDASLPLISA